MLRAPSRKKRRGEVKRLNLIPILDAIFIFIFFLLMSANFIKIYEVQSDVPIVSTQPPPKNKKPLALTLKIRATGIDIFKGVPQKMIKRIGKNPEGEYDLEELHSYAIKLKSNYKKERNIIMEPLVDVEYEQIVKIMDAIRMYNNTDDKLWEEDAEGNQVPMKYIFDKIVFGNIRS
jgi:biopolymer transport protein ExbD